MKQYESYKDSGIEWLGKIPSHWDAMKLKYVCHITDGTHYSPEIKPEGMPYITVSNVNNGIIDVENANKISVEEYEELVKQGCQPQTGDVLLAKDGTVGRTAIVTNNKYVVLSSLGILHPLDNILSSFLKYSLDSHFLQEQMSAAMAGSALRRITISKICEFVSTVPTLSEQRIIASYLDNKVSQIDVTIAEKEKMIEDLQNYRKSIISETVTRGLDPNVPMKDSGVEWIGMIPEDWESVRLSRCAEKIGSGKTPSGGADVYTESGIMFIRSQNVYDEGLQLDGIVYIPEEIDEAMSSTSVLFDDVLLNITGGSIGRSCYISDNNIKANVNQHVCIIRTKKGKLNAKFLHLCLISEIVQNQIKNCQTGGNREELNFEQIGNFIIPYPDLTKQEEIASYLERKLVEISETYKFIQSQIEDLKAYKSSLITEAVTGKIDLRNE